MCGIVGMFDISGKPVDRGLLSRMMSSIQHRGPDGDGQYVNGSVALGHRRLSIIDLGGGAQPIGNETGEVQVIFNGEIYNFIELRKELEAAGHVFKTHSDTEVIVHAYEEWGADSVKRFNGMFAFALWDNIKRRLFIARDHLGIKPLYYIFIGSTLLFGSEIKPLLAHPDCPREVDRESLAELFTFRYVPSPKTLFKQVMKLPPAHHMVIEGGNTRIERYWNWVPTVRTNARENDLVAEYQSLFEDAVRLQMRADVPVGIFLSSGIDSSAILATMRQYSNGAVEAFTIGFEDGEKTSEVEDAARIAAQFGARHHYEILSPRDYIQYYERYMTDIEEPVGNETAAAFYFVSRLARKHVKVALTGQGADEPWAGYDRSKGMKLSGMYSRFPDVMKSAIEKTVGAVPGRMEKLKRGVSSLGERDMLTRLSKVYSFFGPEMKAHLFKGTLLADHQRDPYHTRHALARLQRDVAHLDPVTQMLYVDARANLPDDLLMVADKTSMANSLESRVPFLDVRLVEFIESLPVDLKLRGFTGKYLHKKAMTKWLTPEIVYRKKKGFANPIEEWFRVKMRGYVEDCLLSPQSSMRHYFDQNYIRRILELDREGKAQYRRHIYLLVSLELWHRAFIK